MGVTRRTGRKESGLVWRGERQAGRQEYVFDEGRGGKSGSEDGGRAERQESWDSFGRWVVGFVWKNRIEVVQSKNALSKGFYQQILVAFFCCELKVLSMS